MSVIVEELSDLTTSERYLRFGRLVGRQQSRLAEELSLWVAQDPGLLSWLDELPVAHRHPQLLFSAIRYLGGTPGSGAGLQRWVRTEGDALRKVMLGRSTQLNEPGRCAPLLPLLATIRQPLALLEVGASAGLCLYPDRYGYDFSGEQVGDPSSAVQLRCEVAGPMSAPAIPQVMWRAGIDR